MATRATGSATPGGFAAPSPGSVTPDPRQTALTLDSLRRGPTDRVSHMSAAIPLDQEVGVRTVLVYLGTAMVATGQPVGEVEDELTEVSVLLGYPDVQIAAAPTGVTLSLASGHPSTYEAVSGPLRLDQAAEVR